VKSKHEALVHSASKGQPHNERPTKEQSGQPGFHAHLLEQGLDMAKHFLKKLCSVILQAFVQTVQRMDHPSEDEATELLTSFGMKGDDRKTWAPPVGYPPDRVKRFKQLAGLKLTGLKAAIGALSVPLEFMITLETKEETKSQTTKVMQGFEGLVVAMELQKLGYQCWLKYLSTKGDEAVFQELGPLARDASAKNKRFEELREDLFSLPSALTGAYDLGSKEGQANLVKFMEPVQNATDSAIQFLSSTYHVMKDIGRENLSGFITDLKEMLPNWDVRPELNTEAALPFHGVCL